MDCAALNAKLAATTFVNGFTATQEDATAFREFLKTGKCPCEFPNILRWFNTMMTMGLKEMTNLPGEAAKVEAVAEKPVEKKAAALDLFGDDDDEEEDLAAAKARMVAAAKAKAEKKEAEKKKAKPADRSMIVLHIKPVDDEVDVQAILDEIPSKIVFEGLQWGEGELQEACFGLKRIAMPCIVVDDLCSIDDVNEKIEETYEGKISSVSIESFNKM